MDINLCIANKLYNHGFIKDKYNKIYLNKKKSFNKFTVNYKVRI
jgi:hypothetical protein